MTPEELLDLYDREVRGSFPHRLPAGWVGDQDGPLTRCLTPQGGFAMFSADASHLTTGELEALVDRTFAFYAERGRRFEWKTFEHDRADLLPLLVRHGAVPEPREALVLGESAVLAGDVTLPDGLTMRAVTSRADLERVAAFESAVWDEDWAWLADDLEGRLAAAEPAEVLVVEDGERVVSAAWLVPLAGTSVAGLSGAAARSRRTAVGASTGHWWRTGPGGPSSGAAPCCRSTPRTTAAPSSSGWGCRWSGPPCPTRPPPRDSEGSPAPGAGDPSTMVLGQRLRPAPASATPISRNAAMTATMKPRMFSSKMSPVPRKLAMMPPMRAPARPSSRVQRIPSFWRPGLMRRAMAPMTSPMTMSPRICMMVPLDL